MTWPDLSPGLDRTGRAGVCLVHEGQVLMVGTRGGRWTMPGGGIEPGETAQDAAMREAWEESGARVELIGEGIEVVSPHSGTTSTLFLARLIEMEASPEGRARRWVDPREPVWAADHQIAAFLPHLDVQP